MATKKKAKPQRLSAQRKLEAVRRLLAGEDLDLLARELGVPASRVADWRETTLRAAEAALKSRQPSQEEDEVRRLKALVGDLTMRNELLREENRAMKAGRGPFASRRSRP